MPVKTISSLQETKQEIAKIKKAAEDSVSSLKRIIAAEDRPIEILRKLKSERVGRSPYKPENPLNIIEQRNQTFTALTPFTAAD